MRRSEAPSKRVRVRRLPENAAYDRVTIEAILDEALVCHLAFVHDGQPFAIPTLHARLGDRLYVHGSSASRALRVLRGGAPVGVTVTLLDGLVLARSIFEHSVEYRSVVALGTATLVDDPAEKLAALEAFSEKLLPGRWAEVRPPTRQELKATAILWLPLDEASAKVSAGPPDDGDGPDSSLDVWAGTISARLEWGDPVADPLLRPGIPVPPSLRAFLERRGKPG